MSKNENVIAPLYSTFQFVGYPIIPKDKFFISGNNGEGFISNSIRFGLKIDDSNTCWVEISGGYNEKNNYPIKTISTSNEKLEVLWKDRFDPVIVSNVADFKKIKIQLKNNDEVQKFLHPYDAIQILKNGLNKDVLYFVSGDVRIERYFNTKLNTYSTIIKYVATQIVVAKEKIEKDGETEIRIPEKPRANATMEFIFNKDSLDESRFKSDKKIDVTAYVTSYDRESKKTIFLPINLIINGEKLDFNNQEHIKKFDFLKKCFTVKGKKYYRTQFKCGTISGREVDEIKIEDLTTFQKEQIALGLKTFEQIKIAMQNKKAGSRITEIRLLQPTEKYPDGNEETEYIEEDFIVPEPAPKTEKFEDIEKKTLFDDPTFDTKEIKKDDDYGDLFG